MEKKLYYVVISGGDGSASPSFIETRELSEWIEMYESEHGEGFTESAGWVTLKSDSPIEINGIETKESYYLENFIGEWSNIDAKSSKIFIDTFFSGVRPTFEVRDSDIKPFTSTYGKKDKWMYYDIYCDDKFIKTEMYKKGTKKKKVLKSLNEKFYDSKNNELE